MKVYRHSIWTESKYNLCNKTIYLFQIVFQDNHLILFIHFNLSIFFQIFLPEWRNNIFVLLLPFIPFFFFTRVHLTMIILIFSYVLGELKISLYIIISVLFKIVKLQEFNMIWLITTFEILGNSHITL